MARLRVLSWLAVAITVGLLLVWLPACGSDDGGEPGGQTETTETTETHTTETETTETETTHTETTETETTEGH
jgi:hypothetical protein